MTSIHVMCDLEATGISPGCKILSVALVPFLTEAPLESFYDRISVASSARLGMLDDEDTIKWWNKQKPEIQDEAFSGIREAESVMESISLYMKQLGEPKDIYLWGNGSDFDNPILAHYFKVLGIKQPWGTFNNRCYRTLKNLWKGIPFEKPEDAHNALADAMAQANHAARILSAAARGLPCSL